MTDLDAKFKEIDANSEPVQPTRFLRSQRKKTKTSSVGAPAVTESKAFDASDLFDPVDVLKELKNAWFTDIVRYISHTNSIRKIPSGQNATNVSKSLRNKSASLS
jgi:hypothetical protein